MVNRPGAHLRDDSSGFAGDERCDGGGCDRRLPPALGKHRRVDGLPAEATPGDLLVDVGRVAGETQMELAAVSQDRRRTIETPLDLGDLVGVGHPSEVPPLGRRSRPGSEHELVRETEDPERADEQSAEIEPAHVLDRRSAGLHEVSLMIDEPDLQHDVADRAPPESVETTPSAGQRTSDRSAARIGSVDELTIVRERRVEFGDRGAGPDPHDHLVGLEVDHTRWRLHPGLGSNITRRNVS